ncbi:MAG TPA: TolC family protein, partial [Candidatus Ozemobacteraceae bacterium]|nr:TolC family protein [Candidatus Ozemobacteraceae bacterium]
RDITEAKETQATLDVLCETKKLYCAILTLENARTANQSAIRLFSDYCSTIERLVREGYAQKADLLDVKARLAQVEARDESIRLKHDSLLETLGRLCGLAAGASLRLTPLSEPTDEVATVASDLAASVPGHPLIRAGQLQKKLAVLDKELKKGEFRPNLTFTVDRLQGHRTADYLPKQMSSAGLLVSWDPFDWGKRKHELDGKQMACRQADLALAEIDKTVRETIRATQRRVLETRAQLTAARKKCDWAEEQARVFRNRLSEKAILPKDLLEAEAQLAEAQFLRHQACLDVWVAQAELEKALGDE